METEIIQSITNELLERYSKRFQRLGKDIKTLGWVLLNNSVIDFYSLSISLKIGKERT
ncbi:hypothetical protein LEP1GSC175_1719 [Leptospira santarosai str. HAI821]|uniref:hypothetical protein n=1 Tax=Leptospira santarosai TaxID=28183 RepID=UPI0002BDD260|nr:hypothetical protein [Leptospira santarosai]EMO34100.1 hypothetical protein LEP1GSC175_1719 [Leptospira santarosai str. HAI821]